MDAETGYPVLGGDKMCMSCGQCAYVCPTKSRWLVPRDPSTRLDRFPDIVESNNRVAADRFEREGKNPDLLFPYEFRESKYTNYFFWCW